MTSYNTKVIVKAVILKLDRSILLLRRSIHDEKGAGDWDLPGGTVDKGEDFTAAVCREIFEETGIQLAVDDWQLVYTRSGKFQQGNRCWLVFIGSVSDDQFIMLSHEHEDFKWVTLTEACSTPMFEEQERALAYIAENVLAA